jgi:hypothetical protein
MNQPLLPSELIRNALKAQVNDVINKLSYKKPKNKAASYLHQLFFERMDETKSSIEKLSNNPLPDPHEFSSYE